MAHSFVFCNSKVALENTYSIDHYNLEKDFFSFTPLCPSNYEGALCVYQGFLPLVIGSIFNNDGKLIGYKIWRKVVNEHYHCMIEIVERNQRQKGLSVVMSSNMVRTVIPHVTHLTKVTIPDNKSIECEPKNFYPLHQNIKISSEELMLIKNLNPSYETRIIKNFYQIKGVHGCIKSYKIN